jgi:SAM-dependent methyltransferase
MLLPFRFLPVRRRFGHAPFTMLDVGAGNHSATLTKRHFPACRYVGVDRVRDYNNAASDFDCMDDFVELDLTTLAFEGLADGGYDVIMLSHVLEHLHNGDDVLRGIAPKLAPGGLLYAEFPGPRSLHLPSMPDSLAFTDDPTHVRLFSAGDVADLLCDAGLNVVAAGTRRDWRGMALMPLRIVKHLATKGYVSGGVFWDVTGFADYVVAERPR